MIPMHHDDPIVTPQVTKNTIVTLNPTWKNAHPSGHTQKLNKNSLMSTKNQTTHPPSKPETFNIEGFKLIKPRLQTTTPQKQLSAGDWQHPPSPKPIKITVFD